MVEPYGVPIDSDGMQITPFGKWPADCIRSHENGAIIRAVDEGVEVTSTDGTIRTFAKKPHCVEHAAKFAMAQRAMRAGKMAAKNSSASIAGFADGWKQHVGDTVQQHVGYFEGSYTIPQPPPSGGNGQLLYYFLGVQDNGGGDLTILQPVLEYGRGETGEYGWAMASWNCCPQGEVHNAPAIFGLQPGTTAQGSFKIDDNGNGVVQSSYNGQQSTLQVSHPGDYNWLNVALEVYSVQSCGDYAGSDASVTGLTAQDTSGNGIDINWGPGGDADCGGTQNYDSTSWTVHNDN